MVHIENSKILKYCTFRKKPLVLSIIGSNCNSEDEKTSKKEESIEILKVLGLTKNI